MSPQKLRKISGHCALVRRALANQLENHCTSKDALSIEVCGHSFLFIYVFNVMGCVELLLRLVMLWLQIWLKLLCCTFRYFTEVIFPTVATFWIQRTNRWLPSKLIYLKCYFWQSSRSSWFKGVTFPITMALVARASTERNLKMKTSTTW